jgi:type I restriction enzyme S subunit
LGNLLIPLPPLSEQKRIAAILNEQMEAVQKAREATQAQLEAAKALSAAYLRQVFLQPGAELPTGWRWVRLGEVCRLVNGDAYRDTDWSTEGTPIIRIQNLNDSSKPFNYWAGPLDNRVSVKSGDALLAWSGTPGTSFGAHLWERGPAVLNQHIFRVDLDVARVQPKWAVFAINQQLEIMIGKAHGGVGLRHVTKREVEALRIMLPLLSEQKRITAILNEQMEAVGKVRTALEAQLETIKALPASLLRRAFSGEL